MKNSDITEISSNNLPNLFQPTCDGRKLRCSKYLFNQEPSSKCSSYFWLKHEWNTLNVHMTIVLRTVSLLDASNKPPIDFQNFFFRCNIITHPPYGPRMQFNSCLDLCKIYIHCCCVKVYVYCCLTCCWII